MNQESVSIITLVALAAVAYLIGSIPFGVLIARAKGVDILNFGSKNPGATNVKRALGLKWGVTVFLLDVAKGVVPALLARQMVVGPVGPFDAQLVWFLAGIVAVVGHCLSPFLGFKGGKGIATSLGAGLGAAPLVALSAFGVFIVVVAITRYISLASVLAVPTTLIWNRLYPGESAQMLPIFVALSLFIVWRHRENITRLRAGTESRFSFRDSPKAPDAAPASESSQPADSP